MNSAGLSNVRRPQIWQRLAHLAAGPLILCSLLAGCVPSQINKHATALSESLAPFVEQSSVAYRQAVSLHNLRNDYEAVVAYEVKDQSYNPRDAPVLLAEKDIQARLAVLAALQVYSKTLVAITQSTDSSELDAASESVGSNLTSLGNDLGPSIENVLGIAAASGTTTITTVSTSGSTSTSSTTTSSAPTLSPEVRNGISTAIDAMGQYFVNRKLTKELPGYIEKMDPNVQMFCKVLKDDIRTLDALEERDYNRILNLEKQFLLEDEQPGKNVNPEAWRREVMELPEIARQQEEAHERLSELGQAIDNLALTHHALTAAAQNNNPESFETKLKDLADAGSSLGKFYSSLPTN